VGKRVRGHLAFIAMGSGAAGKLIQQARHAEQRKSAPPDVLGETWLAGDLVVQGVKID